MKSFMAPNLKRLAAMLLVFTGTLFVLMTASAIADEDYKYMDPEDFKIRMETKEPTILVDIQKRNAYLEHHFYGSIRTYAYPAKTELDTESLYQAVRVFEQTQDDVVIIGPRGGRACKRAQDYLVSRGIPVEKIFILKGGISKWPFRDMLLNLQGGCG